jgi:hypothetical protein
MSLLIIHLPVPGKPSSADADSAATLPNAGLEYAYAVSADGRTVASSASAPLALLPPTPRNGEVVAVVPVQALSWHAVELPPTAARSAGANSPRLTACWKNACWTTQPNCTLRWPLARWRVAATLALTKPTAQSGWRRATKLGCKTPCKCSKRQVVRPVGWCLS